MIDHDLNDILIECLFNNKVCDSSNFIWSFNQILGNCYTFNSGFDSNGKKVNLIKSYVAGPDAGLNLKDQRGKKTANVRNV